MSTPLQWDGEQWGCSRIAAGLPTQPGAYEFITAGGAGTLVCNFEPGNRAPVGAYWWRKLQPSGTIGGTSARKL